MSFELPVVFVDKINSKQRFAAEIRLRGSVDRRRGQSDPRRNRHVSEMAANRPGARTERRTDRLFPVVLRKRPRIHQDNGERILQGKEERSRTVQQQKHGGD